MNTLRVNEIFYSLQGEGHFTGTAAIFIRLSGCNIKCSFCDTDHEAFRTMTYREILDTISQWPSRHIVITGGEPALQLTDSFITVLHDSGYFVQVETNGTLPLPDSIDWITCSPKQLTVALTRINELKVVYQSPDFDPEPYCSIKAGEYRLQPCDCGEPAINAAIRTATINYILSHPFWHLSLQTHKLLNIQ